MKSLRLFASAFLAVLMLVSSVAAAHDPRGQLFGHFGDVFGNAQANVPDFFIEKVEVDGTPASTSGAIFVERGSTVYVDVWLRGNNVFRNCRDNNARSCYDVKVKAFIGGYEYGDVEDSTSSFEVEPGVRYHKTLRLVIPEDIDASDDYTLRVEAFDDDQSTDDSSSTRIAYKLRLQEARHSVSVFDVLFNPSASVQAGQPLFATVRVENLGDNIEDSVRVSVSIPALGVQVQEYVDELETNQNEREDDINDAATTNDLVLMIPESAKEGDYDVVVRLDYNRFHSFEEQKYSLHVVALPQVAVGTAQVNVDTLGHKVSAGQGAVYKFTVANLASQAQSYTVEVVGASDWATTRVDPMVLNVQPNSVGEVNIYVSPKEGVTGGKNFAVRVKSGNSLVAEKNLSLEVTPALKGSDSVKKVLTIVFIVLLLVLVLLVVVLLIKKLTEDKEEGVEGKTYY
ncbi:MAG TPA: hypothetical protein VJG30_02210 [Candidatus Nanoarchaeia archaeon]|nr:hypothetical protein [Candidatus Nanoarchaeia archaeon]